MGKTEAAVLPIFNEMLARKSSTTKNTGIKLLYITPLRALNRDMLSRMTVWGTELGIDIAVRHGDTPQKERTRQSKHPPEMLITTPETLQIIFTGKRIRNHLLTVQWVIIDEVHELSQDDRGAQLSVALERLCAFIGRDVQRIGLSATVGTPSKVGKFLAGTHREIEIIKVSISKAIKLKVESPKITKGDTGLAEQIRSDTKSAAYMRRARKLIEDHTSTLFFVNTREGAERLAARFRLWDSNFPVGVHHGSLARDVRVQMEDEFKSQALSALICTSSLELGIDIGSADYTIQYNSPREVTRLVQRVGRAGHRIGEVSQGTVIATTPDDIAESCVIARRVLDEKLEEVTIRDNPLSVLANQLVSFTMLDRRNSVEDVYNTITRAYPFRNLKHDKFIEVLIQLNDIRAVWYDPEINEFGKRRGSITYFYDNISMIPDEKTFKIIDITTRRPVGTLDEGFVTNFIEPYAKFIVKGISWRVVEIKEDDRIVVEPVSEVGAIPGWIGEEIPVPFEVAQEVGKLRARIAIDPEVVKNLAGPEYPIKARDLRPFTKYIEKQVSKNYPVPSDKLVIIEPYYTVTKDIRYPTLIINACFGSKVNETLGRLLSTLIATKLGASVGIQIDPYRMILELPVRVKPELIVELLTTIKPSELDTLFRLLLKNSSFLKWQLVHVARKFGALEKNIDHKHLSFSRLIDVFQETPLFEEAVNKVLWEKMDTGKTRKVLELIQSGEIKLKIGQLSPIGIAGLEARRELITPDAGDRSILVALKKRLETEPVKLVCLNCGNTRRALVEELEPKLKCPTCDGVLLAALRQNDDKSVRLLRKKRHKLKKGKKTKWTPEEKRELKRLNTNANIVRSQGKHAVMALVGRGIGPDTAARILRKQYLSEDEQEFLREILKAEINYARTKRFWD
jgi:ATP-dependent Lhr-like helicase